jgi:hypothetical protein
MFWIDARDETIKPPTDRPILCYCPGWNNAGYQVAYYSKGRFDYDESPNETFNDHVEQWFVFLEAD